MVLECKMEWCVMLRFTPVLNNLDPKKPSFTSYHSISFTYQGMRFGIILALEKVYFNHF